MKNFKPLGTLIHGIASSEHLDSSGERISIKGLDISSLMVDGVFNFEHKNDTPAQIVGKILFAKKIFAEEDCSSAQELYFWKQVEAPYVYVIGELFDGVGHKGAQEIAAMLKYDELARKSGRAGKNTVNFSVEGSKLNKEGQEITRSLARKITITTLACNKKAIAEILNPGEKDAESILDFAKSESDIFIETLEKNAKILPMPQKNAFGPSIGQTKTGKDIFQHAKPIDYKGWTHQDHHDAVSAHIDAADGKDFKTANKHRLMAQFHANARDKMEARAPKTTETKQAPTPAGKLDLGIYPAPNKKLPYGAMTKTLTAGSNMGAPSSKTGGEALSREDLSPNMEKLSNYSKIYKFLSGKYPDMTKDEVDAMAKYMTARQMIKAEETLEKMMDLDKSKNVREQKRKIFGTDANAPRLSEKRQKMMQRIKEFAEKRFQTPMVVAQGKRDESGKIRTDKDNQPAYDVFSPEGVSKEKKILEQYKKKGVKRTDPKPDWRSGNLETQPSPDAAVHELAHLHLAPEGMTAAMFQEEMDRLWGESQSKYGHMQQKRTSGEIQPMSIENPIRRELGIPANRATKPVKQQERALDYEGDRFVEGKDSKGKKVFYDRQSRLSTPETKQRVEDIRQGTLKFHPEHGWFKETGPDALINLRSTGQGQEAKQRAEQRYSNPAPKKMAASEMEKGKIKSAIVAGAMALAPYGYDAAKTIPEHFKNTTNKLNYDQYHEDKIAQQNDLKDKTTLSVKYGFNPLTQKYDNQPKPTKISAREQITEDMKNKYWESQPKGPSIGPTKKMEKAKEDKKIPSDLRAKYREARNKFYSSDPLESEMTSSPGVSDRGIEARRADSKNKGVISHGYARTSSPEFHNKRAKQYFKQTADAMRDIEKPNLPKDKK